MTDDLISRQAAIEDIREYKVEPNHCCDESEINGYNDGLDTAISALATLPSAQQWHTGEPTEDGDYLVFDTEEYYTVDAYYTHNGTEEYGAYLAYKGWQSCNHVKYWMQIPKLPEVEE